MLPPGESLPMIHGKAPSGGSFCDSSLINASFGPPFEMASARNLSCSSTVSVSLTEPFSVNPPIFPPASRPTRFPGGQYGSKPGCEEYSFPSFPKLFIAYKIPPLVTPLKYSLCLDGNSYFGSISLLHDCCSTPPCCCLSWVSCDVACATCFPSLTSTT